MVKAGILICSGVCGGVGMGEGHTESEERHILYAPQTQINELLGHRGLIAQEGGAADRFGVRGGGLRSEAQT